MVQRKKILYVYIVKPPKLIPSIIWYTSDWYENQSKNYPFNISHPFEEVLLSQRQYFVPKFRGTHAFRY